MKKIFLLELMVMTLVLAGCSTEKRNDDKNKDLSWLDGVLHSEDDIKYNEIEVTSLKVYEDGTQEKGIMKYEIDHKNNRIHMKSDGDTGELEIYYQLKDDEKADMYLLVEDGKYQKSEDVPISQTQISSIQNLETISGESEEFSYVKEEAVKGEEAIVVKRLKKEVPYTAKTMIEDGIFTETQIESEKNLKEAFDKIEKGVEEYYWFSKKNHKLIKQEIVNTPLAVIDYYINESLQSGGEEDRQPAEWTAVYIRNVNEELSEIELPKDS